MAPGPLARIRRICKSLDGVKEVESVGDRIFAMYASPSDHHGKGRPGIWLMAPPGNQQAMVAYDPEKFFVPPYVGPSGWVGVYLDCEGLDWDEVALLLADAHRIRQEKNPSRSSRKASRPDAAAKGRSTSNSGLPTADEKPARQKSKTAKRVRTTGRRRAT
jgi:hypothetical protein